MQLSHLRALVAVAETGSFTVAANRLSLTQSAVSQAVSAMEEILGTQLVIRARNGVTLSAVGETVLRRAIEVLALLDTIHDEAASATHSGRLRLASLPSGFAGILPHLIRRFRTRYPGIDIVSVEADDVEVEAWLKAGTVDLGLIANPVPSRNAVMLGEDDWIAVLPRRLDLARKPKVPLADLMAQPFVLITFGCAYHAGSIASEHGIELSPQVEARGLGSGLTMVREEIGVTLVPRLTLANANLDGLVSRPLAQTIRRTIGLVASPAMHRQKAAARLLLEMAEAMSPP